MKSTKLKMLLTAAGFFALSATFAQDTTKTPTTDTTKAPVHDSTSMSTTTSSSDIAISASNANAATSVALVSEDKVANKEAKAEKKMEKATPAKLPEDNK